MRSDDEAAERELLERIDNDFLRVIQVYTAQLDEVQGPIYVEQLMLSALRSYSFGSWRIRMQDDAIGAQPRGRLNRRRLFQNRVGIGLRDQSTRSRETPI